MKSAFVGVGGSPRPANRVLAPQGLCNLRSDPWRRCAGPGACLGVPKRFINKQDGIYWAPTTMCSFFFLLSSHSHTWSYPKAEKQLSGGSQSGVPRPAASAKSGNLLEKQILGCFWKWLMFEPVDWVKTTPSGMCVWASSNPLGARKEQKNREKVHFLSEWGIHLLPPCDVGLLVLRSQDLDSRISPASLVLQPAEGLLWDFSVCTVDWVYPSKYISFLRSLNVLWVLFLWRRTCSGGCGPRGGGAMGASTLGDVGGAGSLQEESTGEQCVHVRACTCMCVCVHICACVGTCTCVCVQTCTRVCTHDSACVHTHAFMCACTCCACMCAHIYMWVCARMSAHVRVHAHMYILVCAYA